MYFVNFQNLVKHSINKKIECVYGLVFYKVVSNEDELYSVGHTKINMHNNLYFEFDSFVIDDGSTKFKGDGHIICVVDKKLKSFVVGVNSFGQVVVATNFIFEG